MRFGSLRLHPRLRTHQKHDLHSRRLRSPESEKRQELEPETWPPGPVVNSARWKPSHRSERAGSPEDLWEERRRAGGGFTPTQRSSRSTGSGTPPISGAPVKVRWEHRDRRHHSPRRCGPHATTVSHQARVTLLHRRRTPTMSRLAVPSTQSTPVFLFHQLTPSMMLFPHAHTR